MKEYIGEGTDIVYPASDDKFEETGVKYFSIGQNLDGDTPSNKVKLTLSGYAKSLLEGYKAWAITDENNHLYVGRNENQEGVVYFYISHKRI